MTLTRETPGYACYETKRGVRIIAKDTYAVPGSGVVSYLEWQKLKTLSDSEFDGTVCLELGIGTFSKKEA